MAAPTLPSGRRPTCPAGVTYDPKLRDFVLAADGQMKSAHPVDEGMVLSIFARRGSIKGTPKAGNTLHEIEYLGGESLTEEVRARVFDAWPLSRLVAERKVEITAVRHSANGRLIVYVDYVNKALVDSREATSHSKTLEWHA